MPQIGTVKMRYPGGDPENGPAFPHRWDGERWECAGHKFDGEGYCRCGAYQPPPPDPKADSHAGQHNDGRGPFEVWYNVGNLTTHPGTPPTGAFVSDIEEPGWYWWACHPGCLPDGEAQGPYATSLEAYEDAKAGED